MTCVILVLTLRFYYIKKKSGFSFYRKSEGLAVKKHWHRYILVGDWEALLCCVGNGALTEAAQRGCGVSFLKIFKSCQDMVLVQSAVGGFVLAPCPFPGQPFCHSVSLQIVTLVLQPMMHRLDFFDKAADHMIEITKSLNKPS